LHVAVSRAGNSGGISRTGGRDQAVRSIGKKQQTDIRRGMPTSSRRTRECGVASCSMLRTRLMCPLKVDKLCCRFWLSPTSANTLSKNTTIGCCCCWSDCCASGHCDSCCCLSDSGGSRWCDPCCCCWLDCRGSGCCDSCCCCCCCLLCCRQWRETGLRVGSWWAVGMKRPALAMMAVRPTAFRDAVLPPAHRVRSPIEHSFHS
jgi:hypothetical protein